MTGSQGRLEQAGLIVFHPFHLVTESSTNRDEAGSLERCSSSKIDQDVVKCCEMIRLHFRLTRFVIGIEKNRTNKLATLEWVFCSWSLPTGSQ